MIRKLWETMKKNRVIITNHLFVNDLFMTILTTVKTDHICKSNDVELYYFFCLVQLNCVRFCEQTIYAT